MNEFQQLHDETVDSIRKMADEFDVDGEDLPDNVQRRLGEILASTDLKTALHFSAKARDAFHIGLLASGKVALNSADPTRASMYLEAKAKSADSLARMFDLKGLPDKAQDQRDRAEVLREKAQEVLDKAAKK